MDWLVGMVRGKWKRKKMNNIISKNGECKNICVNG